MKISPKIEGSWREVLEDEFGKQYFFSLKNFLLSEKEKYTIYPKGKDIFNAFNSTPFNKVKVEFEKMESNIYKNNNAQYGVKKSSKNKI